MKTPNPYESPIRACSGEGEALYFDQHVKNGSAVYDYVEWNQTSRQEAAKRIH